MGQVKTLVLILVLVSAAIILSGCTSSSSSSPGDATTRPMVVATVGDPTPTPTDLPDPTVGPTWTPTPTPVPDPVTMSNFNLVGKINPDQKPISDDPNQSLQLNARYAIRLDTATFNLKNTGSATLNNLEIEYELDVPMTVVGNGQSSTTVVAKYTNLSVGTMNPGDVKKGLTIQSPIYEAMQEVKVTITAKWDNGSFQLYQKTLEPNLSGGVSQTDAQAVMTYGSDNNY